MSDELERQLQAFGLSLEAESGEPVAKRADAASARRSRRWLSIAGAAAGLVAVVAGLIVLAGRGTDAPATPPPGPTATSMAASPSTAPGPPTTLPAAIPGLGELEPVMDDPLGLESEGWTLVQRTSEPLVLSSDDVPCADPESVQQLNGVHQTHDILTPPAGGGLDLDITVLDVGSPERGLEVAEFVQAIGQCIEQESGLEIEPMSLSSIRASWFRASPEFALVAVVGEGPRSIILEIENEPFDDDLIADLAHRADRFLRGVDPTSESDPAGPAADTTTGASLPADDAFLRYLDGWSPMASAVVSELDVDESCVTESMDRIDAVPGATYERTVDGEALAIDVRIVEAGSVERGAVLAEDVLAFGRCQAESGRLESAVQSLSAIRASWVRIGPETGFVVVVGQDGAVVAIAIAGTGIGDEVLSDLARRAHSFVTGAPASG